MRLSLEGYVGQKNWEHAAVGASNLSELFLALPPVPMLSETASSW
jgi:hypothetical protein